MFLMALALAAEGLPPFDRAVAEQVCKTYYTKSAGSTAEDWLAWCVENERRDRRHVQLMIARDPALLQTGLRYCLAEWTTNGLVRWGMVDMCFTEAAQAEREYSMYLADARTPKARQAIRDCRKQETDEDGHIDWEDLADCAAQVDPAER